MNTEDEWDEPGPPSDDANQPYDTPMSLRDILIEIQDNWIDEYTKDRRPDDGKPLRRMLYERVGRAFLEIAPRIFVTLERLRQWRAEFQNCSLVKTFYGKHSWDWVPTDYDELASAFREAIELLRRAQAEWDQIVENDAAPGRRKAPRCDEAPKKPQKRGRPGIPVDCQQKLAKIIGPYLRKDDWQEPNSLKRICLRLDKEKVRGPAGHSWKRALEGDELDGTRRVIGNIKYRLYKSPNRADQYLSQQ